MIVGETRTITRVETKDAAFSVANATLVVVQPDGTNPTQEPTITVTGNATTAVTLSALLHPTQAGQHRVTWTFDVGTETYDRVDFYAATWTDMAGSIRRRLQKDSTSLPDTTLDPEVDWVIRTLLDRFTCLGKYASLTGLDQDRFDQAVALLVAAKLRPFLPKSAAAGELLTIRQDDVTQQFAPTGRKLTGLEDDWITEATLALGRVTCIQALYAANAAAFQPFKLAGPTRNNRSQGNSETLLSATIRQITDAWTLEADGVVGF
jgi:hypothetical protein